MADRIRVGVIGATGMVGQKHPRLLEGHPWFGVTYGAASSRSPGMKYAEAVAGRRLAGGEVPAEVARLTVGDAEDVTAAGKACDLVFSAVAMDRKAVRAPEERYAASGLAGVPNGSAHRWTDDVPMLIPEINAHRADIIPVRRRNRGRRRHLIAVKPNCSLQSYLLPLHALIRAGRAVDSMIVTTMQAVSGSVHPGPAAAGDAILCAQLPKAKGYL